MGEGFLVFSCQYDDDKSINTKINMAEAARIMTEQLASGRIQGAVQRTATRGGSGTADTGAALNRAIGRATRHTDNNAHQEALRTFTRHFGYTDLTRELDSIIKEQDRVGYLSQPLIDRVNRVYDEYHRRVLQDYGPDVLRRTYNAL